MTTLSSMHRTSPRTGSISLPCVRTFSAPLIASGVPRLATLLVMVSAAAACSSSAGSGTPTGSGTGASTTTSTGTGGSKAAANSSAAGVTSGMGGMGGMGGSGAGGGQTCPPSMKYGGGEVSVTGQKSVKAKIVDETGAPVVGQPIFICGTDICSMPGTTGANGSASISTSLTEKKPAFKFGDTVSYAELAIPLTVPMTDFTQGGTMVLATGKLAGKPGAALTPGTDATSGDVTVSVPAGATVGISPLVYDTPDKQKLRTVGIPIANVGPVLDPVMVGDAGAGFALLYGLAPAETPVCPAAKVTVALPHATTTPNDSSAGRRAPPSSSGS